MRKIYFIAVLATLTFLYFANKNNTFYPQPTDTTIKWDMEDGTKPDRKAAIEKMHRIEEGLSWHDIEYQNAKQTAILRNDINKATQKSLGEIETIVDGYVTGKWIERGSTNQAGSVLATEYDAVNDNIYTVSAGGTLWQGGRDGNSWEAINQDFNFFNRMLLLVENGSENRLIAAIEGRPHYSDDNGATWTLSSGIGNVNDGWRIKNVFKKKNTDGTYEIFYLARAGWSATAKLMHSSDLGVSYDRIKVFSSSDLDNYAMHTTQGSDDIYLLEQLSSSASKLWKWDADNQDLVTHVSSSPISFGQGRGNLQVVNRNGNTELYAYDNDLVLKKSTDEGLTWESLGNLPITPWEVALYVSPSIPDVMYIGGVNAYRSIDGGQSWNLVNEWYEYYDQVETKLHADMMQFNEFTTAQGESFLLVSNHGGLSASYDSGSSYQNIGMDGLNVAQYYSVATSPADVNIIYAGSQDQGFQRGLFDNPEGALDFEQVISGDYGHIVFTENYQRLWTVYPGGWVTYYPNPGSGGHTDTYEIVSDRESVWIPPMMAHPDPLENIVYIAGGNADGGTGMHIIKMEMTASGIVATNLPHDFIGSQGEISAMEVSPFDHDTWHVMTSNGRYFKSNDGGLNFFEWNRNLPGGHYLYGSDIMASKIDPSTLYISGSGYSTAPVSVSRDGGFTFEDMSDGLPPTLAFGLAANEDESLLFTSTEAGPYVYVVELGQWFSLLGSAAPYTRYWSVEYIPSLETVRFGTYGRGVWDFRIEESIISSVENLAELDVSVYPNPAVDFINITTDLEGSFNVKLLNGMGQLIVSTRSNQRDSKLDLSEMQTGAYYVIIESDEGRAVKTIIKN